MAKSRIKRAKKKSPPKSSRKTSSKPKPSQAVKMKLVLLDELFSPDLSQPDRLKLFKKVGEKAQKAVPLSQFQEMQKPANR